MSNNRRHFLNRFTVAAAGLVAASGSVLAEGKGQGRGRPGHSFVVPVDTKNKCATCVFWGGQRHISRDKTAVHVTSLGMCNNPASGNYHRTTSPDTGPMAAWVKWSALDA